MAEVSIKEAFKSGQTFSALAKFKNTEEALNRKAYIEGIRLKLIRIIPVVFQFVVNDCMLSLKRETKQRLDLVCEAQKMRNDAGKVIAQTERVVKEIKKLDKICEGSINRIESYLKYVFSKEFKQDEEELKVIKAEAIELYNHAYYWS